jgi:hypothetical protein
LGNTKLTLFYRLKLAKILKSCSHIKEQWSVFTAMCFTVSILNFTK